MKTGGLNPQNTRQAIANVNICIWPVIGHDANNSGTDLCPRHLNDAASRHDISSPFSIQITELEATEYIGSGDDSNTLKVLP